MSKRTQLKRMQIANQLKSLMADMAGDETPEVLAMLLLTSLVGMAWIDKPKEFIAPDPASPDGRLVVELIAFLGRAIYGGERKPLLNLDVRRGQRYGWERKGRKDERY